MRVLFLSDLRFTMIIICSHVRYVVRLIDINRSTTIARQPCKLIFTRSRLRYRLHVMCVLNHRGSGTNIGASHVFPLFQSKLFGFSRFFDIIAWYPSYVFAVIMVALNYARKKSDSNGEATENYLCISAVTTP